MPAVIDPFGVVLAILKADATLLALVPATRISSEYTTAPCVVLTDLATTRRPYGPGSGRLGHLGGVYVAKCYGVNSPTGAISGRQVAGAVSGALHNHGTYRGTSNRLMFKAYAPDIDGLTREPEPPAGSSLPRYDVTITPYFAAEAVA